MLGKIVFGTFTWLMSSSEARCSQWLPAHPRRGKPVSPEHVPMLISRPISYWIRIYCSSQVHTILLQAPCVPVGYTHVLAPLPPPPHKPPSTFGCGVWLSCCHQRFHFCLWVPLITPFNFRWVSLFLWSLGPILLWRLVPVHLGKFSQPDHL